MAMRGSEYLGSEPEEEQLLPLARLVHGQLCTLGPGEAGQTLAGWALLNV